MPRTTRHLTDRFCLWQPPPFFSFIPDLFLFIFRKTLLLPGGKLFLPALTGLVTGHEETSSFSVLGPWRQLTRCRQMAGRK